MSRKTVSIDDQSISGGATGIILLIGEAERGGAADLV
jgi:hypothetical protein